MASPLKIPTAYVIGFYKPRFYLLFEIIFINQKPFQFSNVDQSTYFPISIELGTHFPFSDFDQITHFPFFDPDRITHFPIFV